MLQTIMTAARIKLARGEKRRALAAANQIHVYRAAGLASYGGRWLGLPLERIFVLNGTDKHLDNGHRYGPHYAMFFREFRWKAITMLEIGIGGYKDSLGGQSINSWRWYFPRARIVACDIEDRRALASRAVKIYRIDQSKQADLEHVAAAEGPFEIILDDGSHVNAHQLLTFRTLFSSLKDGGLYVIEDVQTSYWRDMGGDAIDGPIETCMKFFTRMAHYLNVCEFDDGVGDDRELAAFANEISTISFHHNLIIIKKDVRPKSTNLAR